MRLNLESFDHGLYSCRFPKQIQHKRIHKQNLCVTDAKYTEVWVSLPRITQFCILVRYLFIFNRVRVSQSRALNNKHHSKHTVLRKKCRKNNEEEKVAKKTMKYRLHLFIAPTICLRTTLSFGDTHIHT